MTPKTVYAVQIRDTMSGWQTTSIQPMKAWAANHVCTYRGRGFRPENVRIVPFDRRKRKRKATP